MLDCRVIKSDLELVWKRQNLQRIPGILIRPLLSAMVNAWAVQHENVGSSPESSHFMLYPVHPSQHLVITRPALGNTLFFTLGYGYTDCILFLIISLNSLIQFTSAHTLIDR